MLLSLMIVCAVGAILLLALGGLDVLRDLWAHPDHRPGEFGHPSKRNPDHHDRL